MMGELDDVVHLERLRPGLSATLDLQAAGFIEDLSEGTARPSLSEAGDELASTVLGHQEVRRERVRADLDEVVALRGATDQAEPVAVGDDVRVLMGEREPAAQVVMCAIRHD